MAAHHISGQEAFELLRSTSQELNMKLAQVASQIIEGQESQFRPSDAGAARGAASYRV